ncbi:hypothetical protein [Adlercreutzia murintestinalis]|uniref:hypothetical protein n=1 Tax=Adlercreutzia murintestinalis TaxID=2941325 RepID=UPI002041B667|nr:hypothetical protein [Adlercreutzia murintestinalis]
MLEKLFRTDFKALSRILLPLHLVVVGIGVLATFAGFAGYSLEGLDELFGAAGDQIVTLLSGLAALFLALSMFLLFCACVTTFVVVVVRFYRNLFSDEGYLTLTLPVTAGQLVTAKVLAGLLWMVIDALVVLGCVATLSAGAEGFTGDMSLNSSLPAWLLGLSTNGLASLGEDSITVLVLMRWWAQTILQMLFALLVAYLSFALGAALARQHKVAAGVGLFIGIWWVYGMVVGAIDIFLVIMMAYVSTDLIMGAMSAASALIQLGAVCGCWALCVFLLKHRVNLT